VDSLVWQIYAGPSMALHTPKIPWLTVGVGLQYTFLRADESLNVSAIYDFDGSEGSGEPVYSDSVKNDVALKLESWDLFQPSWNAGIIIKPTSWLEIGGSVQPAISYQAPGSLDVQFHEDDPNTPEDESHVMSGFLESTSTSDDEVTLLVKVPWIVRVGAQVRPIEPVRVEADFTWTDWSSVQALTITDVNLELKTSDSLIELDDILITDDVIIPTGFQDAWSVRLGGDWQATPWGRFSLGAHYESSAVSTTRQGVSVVDTPKWGIGAGATFTIKKRVALDIAFAEQFLANRDITDSELRQITLQTNPSDPADSVVGEGLVVGNGHFESRLTFAAIGATVFFGAAP
jgi:long-subunit fatty acid transport protein